MNSNLSRLEAFIKNILNTYDLDENELRKLVPEVDYTTLTRQELIELCKQRNLRTTGTKDILIKRLTGELVDPKKKKSKPETAWLQFLSAQNPLYKVSRNEHGNYVHRETGMVFDPSTKRVIGTQQEDGSIKVLTVEDMDKCKESGFPFDVPRSIGLEH
jgi:hypothetical protein